MTSSSRSLRTVIVEDEWVARNLLVEMVEDTGLAAVVGAIETFEDAAELIARAAPFSIDVVFVDINLVGSSNNGLELIQRFVKRSGAPAFVLATALREHALDAYNLGVVDYVLKPFDPERIALCLERLLAVRTSTQGAGDASRPPRIIARNKRGLVFLNVDEVWALEASDGLTLVHSARGTFDVDLSLDTISTSFGRDFLRVARNWLVSEKHLLQLERESGESYLIVGDRDGEGRSLRVPIARDRNAELRAHLLEHGIGIRRR